jgi:hypothetical protein
VEQSKYKTFFKMVKKTIRTRIIAAWRWGGKNVSSVIATLAFIVSAATLLITLTNNERTLRAYVYAEPGNVFNVSDTRTPEPRIIISNSGSTVAKDAKRWAAATLSTIKSSDEINRLGNGHLEEGILNIPPRVPHALIRYSDQLKVGQRDQIAKTER